jgi:hypothetical protein
MRVGRPRRTSSSGGGLKANAANKVSPFRSSSAEGRASQLPSESYPPPQPQPTDSKRTLPSLPATGYETPTQKYFCVLKGCSYSKRPGFPTYDALEMHVSTVHPRRYQDPETKAKLRQQGASHSTIPTPSPQINRRHSQENISLYDYSSRLFCKVQGCPYDANNFVGFTAEEQLNDHQENFDHSSMKRILVRPAIDGRKQRTVREQIKRSAQLINQKFYCSDGNCPYSEGKFVGYGSQAECLGHIRSYHQQGPVENAHVDVNEVDESRRPSGSLSRFFQSYHARVNVNKVNKSRRPSGSLFPFSQSYHQQEPAENAHVDVNEVDKSRIPKLTNRKFYCSDRNCPYSEGKFVGYGSWQECLGHIQSYHKQGPVENAHVDVNEADKSRRPSGLQSLFLRSYHQQENAHVDINKVDKSRRPSGRRNLFPSQRYLA